MDLLKWPSGIRDRPWFGGSLKIRCHPRRIVLPKVTAGRTQWWAQVGLKVQQLKDKLADIEAGKVEIESLRWNPFLNAQATWKVFPVLLVEAQHASATAAAEQQRQEMDSLKSQLLESTMEVGWCFRKKSCSQCESMKTCCGMILVSLPRYSTWKTRLLKCKICRRVFVVSKSFVCVWVWRCRASWVWSSLITHRG